MQSEAVPIAGSAERSAHLDLLFFWDMQWRGGLGSFVDLRMHTTPPHTRDAYDAYDDHRDSHKNNLYILH